MFVFILFVCFVISVNSLVFGIILFAYSTQDDDIRKASYIIMIISLLFFMPILYFSGEHNGYDKGHKQGQVDYYNGRVNYELIEDNDGQNVWKIKEDLEQ